MAHFVKLFCVLPSGTVPSVAVNSTFKYILSCVKIHQTKASLEKDPSHMGKAENLFCKQKKSVKKEKEKERSLKHKLFQSPKACHSELESITYFANKTMLCVLCVTFVLTFDLQ